MRKRLTNILRVLHLQFEPGDELRFRRDQLAQTRQLLKVAGPPLMGLGIAATLMLPRTAGELPGNAGLPYATGAAIFVLITACVGQAWLPERFVTRHGNRLTFVLMLLMMTVLFLHYSMFPLARQQFGVGFLHFTLIMHGMTPYDWRLKTVVNFAIPAGFWGVIHAGGLYPPTTALQVVVHLCLTAASVTVLGYMVERFARQQWRLSTDLGDEKQRSEDLLLNTIPREMVDRLKAGDKNIVDRFEGVSVVFADLVGFTGLTNTRPADQVVAMLNDIFSRFDMVTRRPGVEKIKTIGDAYMVAVGLPVAVADHAGVAADLCLELREVVRRYCLMTGEKLQVRIGIASGPVIAGVIGRRKFLYDLWGDTVNVASRMESHGIPGEIQVAESTYSLLADRYEFEARGLIEVKGKGALRTWMLKRPLLTSRFAEINQNHAA